MGGVEREEGGTGGGGYMYEDGRLTDGEEEDIRSGTSNAAASHTRTLQ